MVITKLEAENVKRLKAVSITPDGNAVVIGGNNAQGKSSTLDAILMGLGGKRAFDAQPVRRGADEANITIELSGDYVVRRTINANGKTELVVTNKDGTKYSQPQKLLDGLMSKISFDPLEFERMIPSAQRALLLQLCGKGEQIDFVVTRRAALARELTDATRDRKTVTEEVGRMPVYPEVTARVSTEGILQSISMASTVAAEAARLDQIVLQLKEKGRGFISRIESLKAEIRQLEDMAAATGRELEAAIAHRSTIVIPDTSEAQRQLQASEEHNEKWAANEAAARRRQELVAHEQREKRIMADIEQCEAERLAILSSVQFPIEGLSVSEEGVLFNGLPFEQASQAERLKISTAIGIALNPELKVLLLRDGSRLDEENLKMVAQMAQAADAQVWIERVSKGEECSVIIEDGEVLK